MAGFLSNLTGNGGLMANATSKISEVRPHILGDLEPKQLSSGSLGGFVNNVKSQFSNVQAAPTVVDKVKTLTNFPAVKSVLGMGQGGLLSRIGVGGQSSSSSSSSSASSELKRELTPGGNFSGYVPPGNTAIAPGIKFH